MIKVERVDEYGKHLDTFNDYEELVATMLVQPSQKWHDENPPIPEEPQPPTEIDLLHQENAMLQMGMMEMTMYAALQDERLQTQENAVMELSMLIAGGGM